MKHSIIIHMFLSAFAIAGCQSVNLNEKSNVHRNGLDTDTSNVASADDGGSRTSTDNSEDTISDATPSTSGSDTRESDTRESGTEDRTDGVTTVDPDTSTDIIVSSDSAGHVNPTETSNEGSHSTLDTELQVETVSDTDATDGSADSPSESPSETDTAAANTVNTDTGEERSTETDAAKTDTAEIESATETEIGDDTAISVETETAIPTKTPTDTEPPTACGNGQLDGNEDCDDANDSDRDGCLSDCTVWFDGDFLRRTRIDIDNTGGEAVQDFPLLITLDASVIDWDALGNAGVCLVSDDHATELPVEAEVWEPGSESLLWVRVPEIAADGTTDIWIYYGNQTDTQGCQPSESVWRDDFAGVWHLDGISDSTSHNHMMVEDGSIGTIDAAGMVGRGREMSDDGSLLGPSNDTLHITGDLTISVWVNFNDLVDRNYDNAILTYGEGDFTYDTNYAYGLYGNSDGHLSSYWAYGQDTTSVLIESDDAGLATDTFFHVAWVRDTSSEVVRFYLDGSQVGNDIPYSVPPDGGTDGVLMIGGNIAGDAYSINGVLDELRISSRAVNNTWIALEYASMTGTLVTTIMDP